MSNERRGWGRKNGVKERKKRGERKGQGRGGQFPDIKFTKSFFRTVYWKLIRTTHTLGMG